MAGSAQEEPSASLSLWRPCADLARALRLVVIFLSVLVALVAGRREVRPASWIRFALGARADRIDAAAHDADPSAAQKITMPAGATRREGVELAARYHVGQPMFADAAVIFNHARFRPRRRVWHADPARADEDVRGWNRSARAPRTHHGLRLAAREIDGGQAATQDGSLVAEGFTLLDAQAGVRWKQLELTVDVLNALDTKWREEQLAVTSRMAYEPTPVTGVSYTPGWPRELIGRPRSTGR